MSIKEKESKTFHEKLKNFFRLNKGGTGNFKGRVDVPLPQDIEKDLGPDVPLSHRGKAIKELSDAVLKNHLEDSAVEKLWSCLKDLLHQDVPREYRHLAFSFFRCLIQGQYDKLDIMRAHFFNVVRTHNVAEDVAHRFELLQSLTENGKDIHYFEEEMGPFMLEWMSAVMVAGRTQEFLSMLVNVIKFNAAYVDEEIVSGLVQNTCYLCRNSNSEPVVQACLQVMDTVLCYTNLPSDSLLTFVSALCRTVNEIYCQSSWKVMRNLLGTHLGHAALYTMCRLLQDQTMWGDELLLRGAIFHITMGLWGTKKVTNLRCTSTSVLPSFLCVLECGHTLVMFEVTLSIQRLVNKYGLELQDPAWDLLLSIIEVIIKYLEKNPTAMVATHLHDTISTVEQLIELGQFNGSVRRVFELIERCSTVRPEASVLRLVSHLSGSIAPTCSLWLSRLNSLLDKYFKLETRTNIRVKVLDILSNVIHTNRAIYEDDLIERIVVPHLQHVDTDPDLVVRNAAAQLLVDLCVECENKRCLELMDILEKLLNTPFEQFAADGAVVTNEMDVIDVKTVVMGLVKIFTVKLYQLPSSHATKAYKLLVNHLESHYSKPVVFENMSSIRYMIFECLLQIRANSYYQVGYPESGSTALRYSPYLALDHKEGERVGGGGSVSPPPMSPVPSSYPTCMVTHLSLTHALKAVITCLKQEKDWKVLQLILHELPHVMQNKALILSRHGNDIELLATALCSMVSDKSLGLPELLRNTPPKLTRSEFHGHVFPVLGALASYHTYLEPNLQQKIIKCLEFGLVSRCARQCVMALTTCTLEMSDAMYKLLPEVLLNLSKISATVHVAVPILEFLSTLTKLPKVFASFVGDQYMSVFAISLPYTNPFKYNHYTVSLAHHVIAMWFLKCRLSFRRDFVRFITCGLKSNVLVPFEEGQVMKKELVNEDSSNRKRSSSLTEQGSRHNTAASIRPIPRTGAMDLKPPIDEALMSFHVELTETCIDLMARYTFSSCSAFPKRFPTADFLLSGGQSMTWLLGNKLITVTTSGCSTKVLKNGLCDKCWLLCRADKEAMTPEGASDQDSFGTRRRHKSAVQRSVSTEVTPLAASMSKDDLNMPGPRLSRQISSEPAPLARSAVTTANSPVDEAVKRSFGIPETHEPEPHKLDQLLFGTKEPERHERQLCACWCQGWAEIYVRRPTGDTSWVMRIQNQTSYQTSPSDFPLADITTLFMPSLTMKKEPEFGDYVSTQPRINTETLADSEYDAMLEHHFDTSSSSLPRTLGAGPTVPMLIPGSHIKNSPSRESVNTAPPDDLDMLDVEEGGKSRNPVRRSNSSPEMSASWKNPFLNREKEKNKDERETGSGDGDDNKKTSKQKDPRVSCEAIPEEISGLGTTPPTGDEAGNSANHPLLLSCHSYPGTATQSPPALAATARTVPPSPTSVISPSSTPIQSPTTAEKTDIKSPIQKSPLGSDKSNKVMSPRQGVDEVHIGQKEDSVRLDPSALPPLHFKRDRGHTISVMSPVRKPPRMDWNSVRKDTSPRSKDPPRSGINPSFVFLQLYHTAHFGSTSEKPLVIAQTPAYQRAVKNLDRIPPYETHKVGVIYVGAGQASNEAEILRNQFGSLRYAEFLQRLGTLIRLKDADPQSVFLGGLDSNGNDGKFAFIWQDDVMQVTFHVATLMPTKESDPLCNGKKLHIGNDYVTIVYNESGQEYNIQTVKCQFNYACVIIQPLDHSTNQVVVKARDELAEHIGHSEPKIVSDQNLAVMARQLALHANLASMISRSLKAQGQDPYASNWLERLRQIKRLRTKVQQECGPASDSSSNDSELFTSPRSARHVHMDDFTEYT